MATKARKAASPDAPQRLPNGMWRHKYGLVAERPLSDWELELNCWDERHPSGIHPVEHLRRCIALLHPESLWNSWKERRFRALCDDSLADIVGRSIVRNSPWIGCGAGGKTHDAGEFGYYYWLADPENTTVILTSTSRKMMTKRIWPIIQDCWSHTKAMMESEGRRAEQMPNLLNSIMELQASKGDSKHAIFGLAVEEGEVSLAVERLKGVHCERIMLIVDEAPGTPEAIFKTISNMKKGCSELIVVPIANGPLTHFDCFSRVCKPVKGWNSISKDSLQWETNEVREFQLPRGTCLHFSGATSPNVVAQKTLFTFLYTWEDWQRLMRDPIAQREATAYQQDYGFWPPEGFLRTVLTEEMIERGNARGQIAFDGPTKPIGSLDPAFGGDRCVLRFGRLGKLADGRAAVQIDECITIPILVDAVDESGKRLDAEYQIANFVRPEAEKRKVLPTRFAVESSGTGRGVAAVLTQEWGEIIRVESGGKASDMPASEEDERPSHQVYDRKITELWFSVQAFVKGGQLGGLTDEDCEQFCARLYDKPTRQYILEKKEDLKVRLGRSPDEADSVACLIHGARTLGMETRGPRGERLLSMWDKEIEIQQRVYAEDALYLPEGRE